MDSQKTTHILLTIIAVGIFFMIFIFMKERYFTRPQIQPVVWEETVPAKPWTTPTSSPITTPPAPTPNPTPTPTPTHAPVTQNIGLVEGQSYFTDFTNATENHYPRKYCGPHQLEAEPHYPLDSYHVFVPVNATSCDPNQFGASGYYMRMLDVKLKSGISKSKLNELNIKYGVTIEEESTLLGGMYILKMSNINLNSYTLAKTYFDTGYFDWTAMHEAYSINSNN